MFRFFNDIYTFKIDDSINKMCYLDVKIGWGRDYCTIDFIILVPSCHFLHNDTSMFRKKGNTVGMYTSSIILYVAHILYTPPN